MASAKTYGVKEMAIAASLVANVVMGGYLLKVQGSVSVQNAIESSTSTGARLTIGGVDRLRILPPAACVATGGLTGVYETCKYNSPYTTTGALLGVFTECGLNVAKALTGDVSFKKALHAATGSALPNLDNIVLGSGSYESSWFATEVAWNPADILTFSTRTTPTGTLNTTRYDCKMAPIVFDKYGS